MRLTPFVSLHLFAAVGLASVLACSGASETRVTDTSGSSSSAKEEGLPCCHGGFIYRCASEEALGRCADESAADTTDCMKTSTTCGAAGQTSEGETSTAADAQAPKKKTGATCGDEAECEGGLCLAVNGSKSGFCSVECVRSTDCPSNYRCDLLASGTKACMPIGEAKIGEACARSMDCESNICLQRGEAAVGYCSATCTVPGDCPLGWACGYVTGFSGKVCAQP
jgi:hypothetical protein